jgi:tetratricopeptide (TPR) repeat protein
MNALPKIALLATALLLGGCSTLPQGESASGDGGTVGGAAAGAAHGAAAAPRGETTARSLRWIMEKLQDGQLEVGREALTDFLQRDPANPTARRLMQQLEADPETLLGRAHTRYTVRAGDSLGGLAARHLGDPVWFLALARYNDIKRPRLLTVGQTLKLPTAAVWPALGSAPAAAASRAAAAPAPAPAPLPLPQAGAGGETYRHYIETELGAGRLAQALAAVDQATAQRPPSGAWDGWLEPLARRTRALNHQQRGVILMLQGHDEAAHEAFSQALALVPDLEPARQHRMELRGGLVAEFHEAAVVHFRNQRLDEAVVLWDKALRLDPSFEPARGYRTRALELKRRLRELEASAG